MKYAAILVLMLGLTLQSPVLAFAQSDESMQRYEDFLRRASEALEDGEQETALLLYTKAQRIHDHPRVRLAVARLHLDMGECAAAKANYSILIEDAEVPGRVRQAAAEDMGRVSRCMEKQAELLAAAQAASEAAAEPEITDVAVVAPATMSDTPRKIGFSLLIGGGVATAVGAFFATGVFVKRTIKECHGLGSTLDAQIQACEDLAAEQNTEFWPAYVQARNRVQRERVVAAILVSAGLAAAGIGTVLVVDDEKRRQVSVVATPVGVAFMGSF